MILNQNQLSDFPVQNQVLPKGGPKAVPINLDFTTATGNAQYELDAQNLQALGRFSNLQTLWIDNSANTQTLVITVGGGGQVLRVKAGYQGYYPILAANPIVLQFAVAATGVSDRAIVFMLNFPLAPFAWLAV